VELRVDEPVRRPSLIVTDEVNEIIFEVSKAK